MKFPLITKEYIRSHNFSCDGLTYPKSKEEVSYRLQKGDAVLTALANNQITLRKKFINLFQTYFKGNYVKLEACCGITEASMRKYLRGNRKDNGRNISRAAVAKISVGLHLSLEESNELFCLQGHSLEPQNGLLDAIVVDALQCKDNIDIFFKTCAENDIKISKMT